MTTVLYEELQATPIEQDIVVTERISFHALRLYLIKSLSPAGNLICKIKKGATVVAEKQLTSAEIEANADGVTSTNYFHGFVKFPFGDLSLNPGDYTIELSSSGYSFTATSFYGWVKEFENRSNQLTGTVSIVADNPHSFQIWEYK